MLLSGGVESTVLLHQLIRNELAPIVLFANYSQRGADAEFQASKIACANVGLPEPQVIDFRGEGKSFQNVNGLHVPLPHRNLVILSVALSWATTHRCEQIALGLNQDDFAKDNIFAEQGAAVRYTTGTETFVDRFRDLVEVVAPGIDISLPQATLTKKEVILLGTNFGIDFSKTFSCMRRGPRHCGICLQCKARKSSFISAGIAEPIDFYQH